MQPVQAGACRPRRTKDCSLTCNGNRHDGMHGGSVVRCSLTSAGITASPFQDAPTSSRRSNFERLGPCKLKLLRTVL